MAVQIGRFTGRAERFGREEIEVAAHREVVVAEISRGDPQQPFPVDPVFAHRWTSVFDRAIRWLRIVGDPQHLR